MNREVGIKLTSKYLRCTFEHIIMKLVIVESPSKTKKIESLLGSGYKCLATRGHLVDVPPSIVWIDDPQMLLNPKLVPVKGAHKIISMLRTASREARETIIACDADREGEMIALNVIQLLGLHVHSTQRARFREITHDAVVTAIEDTSSRLDMNLALAQRARRCIDLVFGFQLSPIVSRHEGMRGLSAGRCQSPMLRLVSCHNKKVDEWESHPEYVEKFSVLTEKDKLYRDPPVPKSIDEAFLSSLHVAKYTGCVVSTESQGVPSAFTTVSFVTACAKYLNMSTVESTRAAQYLYESGAITYPRTDSCHISLTFAENVRKCILDHYGRAYIPEKIQYKQLSSKNARNAQEAHECIRPTDAFSLVRNDVPLTASKYPKVYDLIRRRTLASLSVPVNSEKRVYNFRVYPGDELAVYTRVDTCVIFSGWKIFYDVRPDDIQSIYVKGDEFKVCVAQLQTDLKKGVRPWNEATLVNELEKSGIGRPSTYADIIQRNFRRNYVECVTWDVKDVYVDCITWSRSSMQMEKKRIKKTIGGEKRCVRLTSLGCRVLEFLETRFEPYVESHFTNDMETQLDEIAHGHRDLYQCVHEFNVRMKRDVDAYLALTRDASNVPHPESKNKIVHKVNERYLIYAGENGCFIRDAQRKNRPFRSLKHMSLDEVKKLKIKDCKQFYRM